MIVDLDVLKEVDCRAAAEAMMAHDGRIDAVFHNAGHLFIGYTEAFTPEQLNEVFRSNVLGAHILYRAVLPFMRAASQGTLIYNSSGSAA